MRLTGVSMLVRGCAAVAVAWAVVAVVVVGAPTLGLGRAAAEAQVAERRTAELEAGWNLVGWTGPATPFEEAIEGIATQVQAAASFDGASQSFALWNATGPGLLNTLAALRPGEGLWILVDAATRWEQPVEADATALDLAGGFNLLTWTGPSGLDAAEAFGLLGDDLLVAFGFTPATGTFASYSPSRPAVVNDLAPLTYGDGFWALMDGARAWAMPAAPGPVTLSVADGAATLTVPRGALPPDMDAEALQVSDLTTTAAFAALGEAAAGVVLGLRLEPAGTVFAVPVVVTATVPTSAGTNLFGLLSAGDAMELVSDLSVVEAGAGTVTLAASIPHFSSYWIVNGPPLASAANQDVGEVPAGTRFDADVQVTAAAGFSGFVTGFRDDPIGMLLGPRERRVSVDGARSWGLFGEESFRPIQGPVAPVGFERWIPGPLTPTPPSIPINVRQTFSCDGAGDFVILFLQQASVPVESGGTTAGRDSVNVPDVDAFVRGTCTPLAGSISFFVSSGSGGEGEHVSQIPLSSDPEATFELILHDEANPLPPRFPLTITIRQMSLGTEDIVRTLVLDGDPSLVCSDPEDPSWCSLEVSAISWSERVEISVTDTDGTLFAFAARGSVRGH